RLLFGALILVGIYKHILQVVVGIGPELFQKVQQFASDPIEIGGHVLRKIGSHRYRIFQRFRNVDAGLRERISVILRKVEAYDQLFRQQVGGNSDADDQQELDPARLSVL